MTWTGPPTEVNESDRIEWVPLDRVPEMVDRREIVSGPTIVGLLRLLTGPLRTDPATVYQKAPG